MCKAPFPRRISVLSSSEYPCRSLHSVYFSDAGFAFHDVENSAQISCKISDAAVFPAVSRMRIGPVETRICGEIHHKKKKIKSRFSENGIKVIKKLPH